MHERTRDHLWRGTSLLFALAGTGACGGTSVGGLGSSPVDASAGNHGDGSTAGSSGDGGFPSVNDAGAVSPTPDDAAGAGTTGGDASDDGGTLYAWDSGIDPTHLPIDDGVYTLTTPAIGTVYRCTAPNTSGAGAQAKGPWFNSDGTTWNSLTKLVVEGAVSWSSTFAATVSGSSLSASGNGLPSHTTGTFPIASTDPVYQYDSNPNSIETSTISWALAANPTVAASPSCLPNGAIGVLLTGARIYNANDELGRDAVAWEGQDHCQGHPQMQGQYHYHSVSSCAGTDTPGEHSPLVGYAADGFGVFGNLGVNGQPMTDETLDECHGHTHAVSIRGTTVVQYHYHATKEYPYTLGCYKGTPVTIQ